MYRVGIAVKQRTESIVAEKIRALTAATRENGLAYRPKNMTIPIMRHEIIEVDSRTLVQILLYNNSPATFFIYVVEFCNENPTTDQVTSDTASIT